MSETNTYIDPDLFNPFTYRLRDLIKENGFQMVKLRNGMFHKVLYADFDGGDDPSFCAREPFMLYWCNNGTSTVSHVYDIISIVE